MTTSRSFGPACTPGEPASSTACLCVCHFLDAACDDAVCATTVSAGAATDGLRSSPAAPLPASGHRTPRTIATPFGPTTRFAIR